MPWVESEIFVVVSVRDKLNGLRRPQLAFLARADLIGWVNQYFTNEIQEHL